MRLMRHVRRAHHHPLKYRFPHAQDDGSATPNGRDT